MSKALRAVLDDATHAPVHPLSVIVQWLPVNHDTATATSDMPCLFEFMEFMRCIETEPDKTVCTSRHEALQMCFKRRGFASASDTT